MNATFFGYSEISILNPQTRYFQKKVNSQLFKKCVFGGADLEIWVWVKLVLWICPILWIRVQTVNTQLSSTFFHYYRPYRPIYRKIKKIIVPKKWRFFNRKSGLEVSKLVQMENHGSPKSASTFPTNPQIWFFDTGT